MSTHKPIHNEARQASTKFIRICWSLLLPVVACTAVLTFAPTRTQACCMVPFHWPGDVDQNTQNVVIFHHDGHEELVIGVSPFFKPRGEQKAPEYFAWVLTLPSTPLSYRLADQEIFKDAQRLGYRLAKTRPKIPNYTLLVATFGSEKYADSLSITEVGKIGPYDITEVKASGREALTELNAYLEKNGFPTEDPEHMAYFVDEGFTFLCIRITPPPGDSTVGEKLTLPPLQLGFKTEHPYYPGKFSSQQGAFQLGLTVISSRPLLDQSHEAMRKRLNVESASHRLYRNLWTGKPLDVHLAKAAAFIPGHEGVERWYVNPFPSYGFNHPDAQGVPAISKWADDVFFPTALAEGPDATISPSSFIGDSGFKYHFVSTVCQIVGIANGILINGATIWIILSIIYLRRRAKQRKKAAA